MINTIKTNSNIKTINTNTNNFTINFDSKKNKKSHIKKAQLNIN